MGRGGGDGLEHGRAVERPDHPPGAVDDADRVSRSARTASTSSSLVDSDTVRSGAASARGGRMTQPAVSTLARDTSRVNAAT